MDAFAVRFIIAVCAYFLLDVLVKKLIKNPDAQGIFEIVLLLVAIAYAVFGYMLFR